MDYGLYNPLSSPGAKKMSLWTLRLAADELLRRVLARDVHLFSLFYSSCAAAIEPPDSVVGNVKAETVQTDNADLLDTLKELQRQFGDHVSGQFADLYLQGFAVWGAHSDPTGDGTIGDGTLLKAWAEAAAEEVKSFSTSQDDNIERLAELIDLTPVHQELLSFFLNDHAPGFSQLYSFLFRSGDGLPLLLAKMFDTDFPQMLNALDETSPLVRSGLLNVTYHPMRVSSPSTHLRSILNEPAEDHEEFMRRFIRQLEPSPSVSSLARISDPDREILDKLIRLPVPDGGIHTLIYGPQSVDKRDMVARLLDQLTDGMPSYIVNTKNVPASDLPLWVTVAQNHLQENDPDGVLVVDRAEQVLSTRPMSMISFLGGIEEDPTPDPDPEDESKADEDLTSRPVRCIWMTSKARWLSERNLGRFLFHCEARPASRGDRRQRIKQVISEHDLSAELEHHLTQYTMLGEQQVRQAARLAEVLRLEGEEREKVIRRAVHQSQHALGREATEQLRDSVTKYSLDYLNVAGKFTPAQIIRSLRERRKSSLCFHGLPGSGKTQLAEFMAVELDLPLMLRSASDLFSKWVGETEQNIAAMFSEAEAEGAILFLDEADSFLRDRSLARAEWSVTQVNELLQRMERFDGIFIAATNLMDVVDAASMRRFVFKLEFLPLKDEQAWEMFRNESGYDGSDEDPETVSLRERLAEIKDLAPGDFATVARQKNLLNEELSPDDWIEQLAAEAKAKMAGLRRQKLGFE